VVPKYFLETKLKFKKGDLVTTLTDFRRHRGIVMDVIEGGEYKIWLFDLSDWDIYGEYQLEYLADG
jgi:hypothetical protein